MEEMTRRTIQRLPPDVVNRVAAGEVVQRPSSAIKELLENSLDAGSTSIQVLVHDGGLAVLQVTDDGSGVHVDDLPLLCERYATSKLRSFEDLQSVTSFGFRGEALASLSYVAHVTVTTRRRPAADRVNPERTTTLSSNGTLSSSGNHHSVAWRAHYTEGVLTDAPQPCAGNYGTSIRAERLFYNAAVRRQALRASEEWGRVLDVVSRYALAFPHVGFSCQKESGDGVSFPKGSTTLHNARISLGAAAAQHLRFFYHYMTAHLAEGGGDGGDTGAHNEEDGNRHKGGMTASEPGASASSSLSASPSQSSTTQVEIIASVKRAATTVRGLTGTASEGAFNVMGYTSDPVFLSRKPYLCLFVNNRLVESVAVRRAVDTVYSSVLTGGHRPTTILFIAVPAHRVDVNVHPTKKGVCLLDEELILGRTAELIRGSLLAAAAAKQLDQRTLGRAATLALQAVSRHGGDPSASAGGLASTQHRAHCGRPAELASWVGGAAASTPAVVVAPCTVVRVEPQKGAMDAFLRRPPTAGVATTATSTDDPGVVTSVDSTREGPLKADGDRPVTTTAADWEAILATVQPAQDANADGEEGQHRNDFGHDRSCRGALVDPQGDGSIPSLLEERPKETEECEDVMVEFKRYRAEVHARQGAASEGTALPPQPLPAVRMPSPDTRGDRDGGRVAADGATVPTHTPPLYHASSSQALSSATLHAYSATADSLRATPTAFLEDGGGEAKWAASRSGGSVPLPQGGDGDLPTCRATPAATHLVPVVPEAPRQTLTSIAAIVESIRSASSLQAQALVDSLALVGAADGDAVLMQSGTTLLLLQVLPLVREVVYQRIFMRWVQPGLPAAPRVSLQGPTAAAPVRVDEAIAFAVQHDTHGILHAGWPLPQAFQNLITSCATQHRGLHGEHVLSLTPTDAISTATATQSGMHIYLDAAQALLRRPECAEDVARYARRLRRRLGLWHEMLDEYFGITVDVDGQHLLGLPCALGPAWRPTLRAVPLFLWLLADTVPYPQERTPTSPNGDGTGKMASEEALLQQWVGDEVACFTAIARHIADVLYGLVLPLSTSSDTAPPTAAAAVVATTATPQQGHHEVRKALHDLVQFTLLPAVKQRKLFLLPASMLSDGVLLSVVTVESLYKVFERC